MRLTRLLADGERPVLAVSQFTLQAKVKKGSKPDYHGAMVRSTPFCCLGRAADDRLTDSLTAPAVFFFRQSPGPAEEMYDAVRAALGRAYDPSRISDGKFGAMMEVASVNDVRPPPSRASPCSRHAS